MTNAHDHDHAHDDPWIGDLLKDSPTNWGKWGSDDEVGSLNYLTPEVVLAAAGAITSGKTFTLQVKMANPEGDPVWPGRSGAVRINVMDEGHFMAGKGVETAGGAHYADDYMTCFLQGSTQYDALGHVWYGDQIWNGYDAKSTIGGLEKASVCAIAEKGVVVDRALSEPGGGPVGILFLDIDRFKHVNDSLGHDAGDRLLVGVADALTEVVRDVDTVARLGGDEFVVLVDGASDCTSLYELAERISRRLEQPPSAGSIRFGTSASIGIAVGGDGEDADQLLRNADVAMYQAKEAGRGRIAVFDEEFRLRSAAQLEIENALRDVDPDAQMLLHFQPVVDLASRRLHGVEALVRWNHPTRGLLAPGEFIPVAEETGLILSLGEWVLVEACRQAVAWEAADGCGIDIAVNVSARQLVEPAFSQLVGRVIEETGIDPNRLLLEVTESAFVNDPVVAIANLVAIRELGVSVALDDYGTGYASLSYLRTLPLSHIKIDRSFIAGLGRSHDATTIVENTISLAGGLGLEVIAEGIETPDQYRVLQEFGCHLAQGYLLGAPMAAQNLERHHLWTSRIERARTATSTPA